VDAMRTRAYSVYPEESHDIQRSRAREFSPDRQLEGHFRYESTASNGRDIFSHHFLCSREMSALICSSI
jgi:hypothetical protein